MTHEQATNILRRVWGKDFGYMVDGHDRLHKSNEASFWLKMLSQVRPERARTRHIVRGIIRKGYVVQKH